MPQTNKTTVRKESNGQYRTTVPKALAEAMQLNGKKVEWSVESANRLSIQVIDDE